MKIGVPCQHAAGVFHDITVQWLLDGQNKLMSTFGRDKVMARLEASLVKTP